MNKWVLAITVSLFNALSLGAQETIDLTNNQEINMIQNPDYSIPEHLYKVVSPEEWQESQLQNEIVSSPADEAFIHLAKEDQVAHVVQKFWDKRECIILTLSSEKLVGRLVYEPNPGGSTLYYHLYEGYIPLDAVVDITLANFKPNLPPK
jgi:uncharacterized protein (DUF952 family)